MLSPAGGMRGRDDDDEELKSDQRRARVWKLLRRGHSARFRGANGC